MKFRIALLAASLLPAFVSAQDWPRYLGPDGSGKVEGKLRSDWGKEKPKEVWREATRPGLREFRHLRRQGGGDGESG
jgi:hypothetical protein